MMAKNCVLCLLAFILMKSTNCWTPLSGKHFRVSAVLLPPNLYIEKTANGSTIFRGFLKDFFDWMFNERINASYNFVVVDAKALATYGIVQASINQLFNREVDIVSVGLAPTTDRLVYMDFSSPTLINQYRLAVPYPKENSRLYGLIRPFQLEVWVALFATLPVFVIFLSLMTLYKGEPESFNMSWSHFIVRFLKHLGDNSIYAFTIATGNGEHVRDNFFVLKILTGAWCLMFVVITNSYTGNLTSDLAVPALKPIPNSLEELALNDEISLIVDDKSTVAEMILNSKSGPLKVLGDNLRRHPEYLFKSYDEGMKLLATYKTAYPANNVITNNILSLDLKKNGRCGLTISKPLMFYQIICWGLPKNGALNQPLSNRLQYMWETGLGDYWRKKHSPPPYKCFITKHPERPKNAPLKLEDLSSAFFIFAIGIGLSIFVFIVEKIAAYYLLLSKVIAEEYTQGGFAEVYGAI